MLTKSMVRRLWSRAPETTVNAIVRAGPEIFKQYGLTSDLRLAHFMAQLSHECGGGTIIRENMNYSASRLMQIFGVGHHSAKVTEAEAQQLAHHPEQIAERVYGLGNSKKAKELGNTQPGDGYAYRGNGMLQLTGRDSHRRVGKTVGVDLEGNPKQLEDPVVSLKVAAAEFKALNCLPAADADDIDLVTRRVNGGRNGLAERTVWLRKWKAALATSQAETPERISEAIETVEAPVPPPQEPRGGESDQVKPMTQSTIGNGAKVTGGLTIGGIAWTIWEKVQELPQSILDALVAAAGKPQFWIFVGVGVGVGFIYYKRFRLKQDAGV